jgi:D-beta-D-heptose 7-phosphate kinase/D-beta-D-heptose 1-phosphate adenosyltransferase
LEEGLLGGIIRLLRSKSGTGSKPAPEHSNSHEADGAASAAESEPGPGFDAILIADYAKGVCNPTLLRRVIDAARGSHIPVIVDPARIADYSRYAGATLLKPNRTETELAAGESIVAPADAVTLGQKLCREHKLGAAVVTLDREGMVLVQDNGSTALFPAEPREVYDITGAGDMVLAALGLCIASDVPLPQAVHVANSAAGLEIARFGVAPVLRQELAQALALAIPAFAGPSFDPQLSGTTFRDAESKVDPKPESQDSEQPKRGMTVSDSSDDSTRPSFDLSVGSPRSLKLISLPEAVSLAATYRSQGKTVVFTNGCFDLLHIGHVSMLEQAAALGDILIVAINSNSSVRNLKGPDRPVVSEQHRIAMLAALGCVDHVLIFDGPTPHTLLEQLRPNVLAKGGTTPEIIGREVVESYGGKVVRLSEVAGISTTSLLSARSYKPEPGTPAQSDGPLMCGRLPNQNSCFADEPLSRVPIPK